MADGVPDGADGDGRDRPVPQLRSLADGSADIRERDSGDAPPPAARQGGCTGRGGEGRAVSGADWTAGAVHRFVRAVPCWTPNPGIPNDDSTFCSKSTCTAGSVQAQALPTSTLNTLQSLPSYTPSNSMPRNVPNSHLHH